MNQDKNIHSRQLIREALVKRLKGKTIAEDRVASSYSIPPWVEELPVILIYAQSETLEERNQAPREMRRNLFISIECVSDGDNSGDLENRLDTLAEQVEQLIAKDDTLDCTVDDIILTSVEFQYEDGGETQTPVGSVRLAFNAQYRDLFPKTTDTCDELESINAKWDIGHNGEPDGNIDANDTIEFKE